MNIGMGGCVYLVSRYGMEVTSEAGLLPGPVSRKGWEAASEYLLTLSKWQLAGERATLSGHAQSCMLSCHVVLSLCRLLLQCGVLQISGAQCSHD